MSTTEKKGVFICHKMKTHTSSNTDFDTNEPKLKKRLYDVPKVKTFENCNFKLNTLLNLIDAI